MKKEYIITIGLALFVLSYVLDFLGGSRILDVNSPFDVLQKSVLEIYPFTAVSIGFKTLAVFIATVYIFSLIPRRFLAKGAFLLFVAAMMELYSIQQLATDSGAIPIVWSVALGFAGIALLLPSVIFLLIGLTTAAHHNLTSMPYDKATQETEEDDGI